MKHLAEQFELFNMKEKSISAARLEIKKLGSSFIGKPKNLDKFRKRFEIAPKYDSDGINGTVIGYVAYKKYDNN